MKEIRKKNVTEISDSQAIKSPPMYQKPLNLLKSSAKNSDQSSLKFARNNVSSQTHTNLLLTNASSVGNSQLMIAPSPASMMRESASQLSAIGTASERPKEFNFDETSIKNPLGSLFCYSRVQSPQMIV
jgi:hypothetical protein